MRYPVYRGRRLRGSAAVRRLVRETRLSPQRLILPLFVEPGEGVRRAVDSMPGVFRTSVDEAVCDARVAYELGLGGVMLFGIPEAKDEQGSGAWSAGALPMRPSWRTLRWTLRFEAKESLGRLID